MNPGGFFLKKIILIHSHYLVVVLAWHFLNPLDTCFKRSLTLSIAATLRSQEAMCRMTEAQLSRIDNLEIGRYGYGAVKWPGWWE